MGRRDTLTNNFMKDPAHFADAFNFCFFNGRNVVNPCKLRIMDPTEIGIIFENNSKEIVQKFRDVIKNTTIMEDDKITYLILGIENQTDIHYAMPVKVMIYDALNYGDQVAVKAKRHRKEKDLEPGGEFLSGFKRTDKIKPIITLTIYWGNRAWDGPRELRDMFVDVDKELYQFINNYKLNLLVPNEIRDFSKFSSSLGTAMRYLSASGNNEALQKVINDDNYRRLDVQTARLLGSLMGFEVKVKKGQEDFDMCEALLQRDNEKREEGEAKNFVQNVETLMQTTSQSLGEVLRLLKKTEQDYNDALKLLERNEN